MENELDTYILESCLLQKNNINKQFKCEGTYERTKFIVKVWNTLQNLGYTNSYFNKKRLIIEKGLSVSELKKFKYNEFGTIEITR